VPGAGRHLAGFTADELRAAVADRYDRVALDARASFPSPVGRAFAESVGYPPSALDAAPAAAGAAFTGLAYVPGWAGLSPGEVAVDLGCGGGLDTVLAARAVGPTGRVHAVDVSPEMAALAGANVRAGGLANVAVHRAPVEALPLPDATADAATANGVFNLAPERERAVAEAFRVLKPGGRLVAAEIVLGEDVPHGERDTLDAWFR
jgi:SAM-dependent methyltransferase